MAKVDVRVQLDMIEVRDALIDQAKQCAGKNTGCAKVEFEYGRDSGDDGALVGATVLFQHKKI